MNWLAVILLIFANAVVSADLLSYLFVVFCGCRLLSVEKEKKIKSKWMSDFFHKRVEQCIPNASGTTIKTFTLHKIHNSITAHSNKQQDKQQQQQQHTSYTSLEAIRDDAPIGNSGGLLIHRLHQPLTKCPPFSLSSLCRQ